MGEDNQEKRLCELFRVLRPLCLDYLKASHLVTQLTFIGEHAGKIIKKERKSSQEATKMMFELIKECNEPDKWKKFTLALKDTDFLSLHKVCDVCERDDFDFYAIIFDMLSADFAENNVDIVNLSQGMLDRESLSQDQFNQIDSVLDEEGEVAAILEFISCLPSSLKVWLKNLQSCLLDLKKNDLHELVQKKGSEMFGSDKHLEALIECWKPLIVNRVRVNDIWSHLKSSLDLEIPNQSSHTDQQRMEKILDDIKDCQQTDKWKSFYDALHAAGFESLCKKLRGDTDVEEDEDYVKLIHICAPEIRKFICAKELLSLLVSKGVIDQDNSQKIKGCREGDIAAAELLLDSIHRKNANWFKIFLQCLIDCKQRIVAEMIDEDFKGLLQSKDEDSSVNKKSNDDDAECEKPQDIVVEEEKIESKPLVIRNYQKELLEKTRNGKNCIICAPTGCGKTFVALKLIEEHLAQNDGQIHKVIFFANQVALVQQQGRKCREYLPQYKTHIITGNNATETRCPLKNITEENDIIVMTPRILYDNLIHGQLASKSLSLFSLLIFDECHHTNKKHPYNELMAMYIDEKLEKNNRHLPQIIGLTASIGVGGAKAEEEAVNHILSICANLDCEEISTIQENLEELEEYINRPNDGIIIEHGLKDNPFKDGMNELMAKVEKRFMDPEVSGIVEKEKPQLFNLLKDHTSEREKNLYTNWLGEIKKHIVLLENSDARWKYHDCLKFLDIYHNALIINDSCRIKDAIAFVQNKLEASSRKSVTHTALQELWDKKMPEFETLSQNDRYFNPLLKKLEEIVLNKIKEIPESRIFIFVRTRALVCALTDWIKESEELKKLNPQQLVGGSKRVDHSGMTTQQQEQRLEEFKVGKSQVLVATLGEEGLDVEKCNLVLNFNDVKNEISMVQKRGRARAKDSSYLTLANDTSGIPEREEANKNREKMMNQALKKVQKLKNEDPEGYLEKKEQYQKSEKSVRGITKPKRILRVGEYWLRCVVCDHFFCISSDVRVINKSQYTILNEDFDSNIKVKSHPKPKEYDGMKKVMKIYCCKCENDLGIKVIYKKHLFPIIKISSFLLTDPENRRKYIKKWIDVPFETEAITPEELRQFPFPENAAE